MTKRNGTRPCRTGFQPVPDRLETCPTCAVRLPQAKRENIMRLATIHTDAGPRAALLYGLHYIDLHATDPTLPPTVRGLLEAGPAALTIAQQAAQRPGAVRVEAA